MVPAVLPLLVLSLADGPNSNTTTLLGSYPHLLKSSLPNLTSANDVDASVAEALRTGQTLMGSYIDECFYYATLRPLLLATRGTGIRVFGMLRSHNGPIYCPAVWGSARSGQEVNWTHVATHLATLSVEFPHFLGYTIDDFCKCSGSLSLSWALKEAAGQTA